MFFLMKGIVCMTLLMFSLGFALAGDVYIEGSAHDASGWSYDADVSVSCLHNGSLYAKYDVTKDYLAGTVDEYGNKLGGGQAHYVVYFDEDECGIGDSVNVLITKGNLAGQENFVLESEGTFRSSIWLFEVPSVPEFGFFMGALTLLSAVGLFFVVRKD